MVNINLEKINLVSQLNNLAKSVKNHYNNYLDKLKKHSEIDKKSYTFKVGRSDRFVAAQFTFYLESYTGYYGSSSCSTNSLGDGKILTEALVRYINKNKETFLESLAKELELMSKENLKEAEDEVDNINKIFNTMKITLGETDETTS